MQLDLQTEHALKYIKYEIRKNREILVSLTCTTFLLTGTYEKMALVFDFLHLPSPPKQITSVSFDLVHFLTVVRTSKTMLTIILLSSSAIFLIYCPFSSLPLHTCWTSSIHHLL